MSVSRASKAFVVLIFSFAVAGACSPSEEPAETADMSKPPMDSLVTAAWLQEHLGDADLVVLDCSVTISVDDDGNFRTVNGRAAYDEGHIPTAGFADLMGELADGDSPHSYAVPAPEAFAAAMSALGVGDDTRVVLYDTSGGPWAARVWWMLRWVGFDDAALLDGGFDAWTDAGFPLSTEAASEAARTLTIDLRPELIVEKDEVLAAIDDDSVEIIDALPTEHFRGDFAMYKRPGHIPTASNVPSRSLMAESGRFKAEADLAALFGGELSQRTITYCGGGIAASTDAFIMTRLGYKDVAVYTASLQEWAADPDYPLVTGAGESQPPK